MTTMQISIGIIYSLLFLFLMSIMVMCNVMFKRKRTQIIVWLIAGNLIGGISALFAFTFSSFEKVIDIFFPYVIVPLLLIGIPILTVLKRKKFNK